MNTDSYLFVQLTKVALTYDNVDSWPLDYVEVTDTKRKNKIK